MPAVSKKQQRFFGYLLSNPDERKKRGISKKAAKDFAQDIQEVSPPGWGHTKAEKEKTKPWKPKSKIGGSAAEFKKDLDSGKIKGLPGDKTKKEKTASMFKLMWSMHNKSKKSKDGKFLPHYKPGTDKKYKKYQKNDYVPVGPGINETSMPNVDPKDRKVIKDRAKTLFTKDLKGTVRGVNEAVKGQSTEYRRERAAERRVPGDPHKKQGDPSKRLSPSAGRTNVGKMVRSIEKYDKKTKETRPSVLGMTTNEGKTWKDFQTAIDRVRGKKTEMPKPKKADDAGARARRRVQRREYQNKVSVIVPPELED